MRPLDPINMPLDGYALIEASAGTGKTYAITSLFLRLIMERRLKVRDILVVTFTRAATEELRLKIRDRLVTALSILKGSANTEDAFITGLSTLLSVEKRVSKDEQARRIEEAILSLDESAVFTIHSFCQRMLREFAFESSAPFHMEVITSESDIRQAACREFVRKVFYGMDEGLVNWVGRLFTLDNLPEAIYSELKNLLSVPAPIIIHECTVSQVIGEAKVFKDKIKEAASMAKDCRHDVEERYSDLVARWIERFLSLPGLSAIPKELSTKLGKSLRKRFIKNLDAEFDLLTYLASSREIMPFNTGDLALFNLANVFPSGMMQVLMDDVFKNKRTKFYKSIEGYIDNLYENITLFAGLDSSCRKSPEFIRFLETPFMDFLSTALVMHGGINERMFSAVICEARDFVKACVVEHKSRHSLVSYDDMIVMLRKALLDKDSGRRLAENIRGRFPAALIDEFQDTDRLQWEIFSSIYPDTEKDMLFLIGDPKQAIYGFRGADIFTYLEARGLVLKKRRFNLDTNWRSTPELVEAVNQIFQDGEHRTFILDGVDFFPVKARPGMHEYLEIKGEEHPSAVEIWSFESTGKEKGDLSQGIDPATFTALEVKRLISMGSAGRAYFKGRGGEWPVSPGDITILVRDFMEARQVRERLYEVGVTSVYYGPESVFSTDEARDILYLLGGVANFTDDSAVSTALATLPMGGNATELHALQNSPEKWDGIIERFSSLRGIWTKHGVFPMLRAMFRDFDIPSRLLGFKGGERRLTNMRQIAEMLAEAEKENPGIEMLISWLNRNIASPDEHAEEQKLRLEDDEYLVTIMSYHHSKGLEFPILFLPFISRLDVKAGKGRIPRYYDMKRGRYVSPVSERHLTEKEAREMVIRGKKLRNWEKDMEREQAAELVRLMYVAFTRARQKVYFSLEEDVSPFSIFGRVIKKDSAAFSGDKNGWDQQIKELLRPFSGNDSVNVLTSFEKQASFIPEQDRGGFFPPAGRVRAVNQPLRYPLAQAVWHPVSFSSLHAAEPAYGQALSRPERGEETGKRDRFSFPRGPKPGNCVHRFFETIDFNGERGDFLEQASNSLDEFSIDPQWADVLVEMGESVPGTEIAPGLRLKDMENKWISKEMGFVWSFKDQEKVHMPGLYPGCEGGVVKGFMDLVFRHGEAFYILDYKTNWLGSALEDYQPSSMKRAMDEHDYWLQAGIYARALHAFLKTSRKDYSFERHLGGVFYLFVRGVAIEHGADYGVVFISREELMTRFPSFFKDLSNG